MSASMNARPDLLDAVASASRPSLGWIAAGQLPVVYHDQYNISFYGLEKLHPFDSCKYRKVVSALAAGGALTKDQLVAPKEATDEMLLDVHSGAYVQAIRTSKVKVATVAELPPLVVLPNFVVQQRVVGPMARHVGGTMLAASLAVAYGWSINIGGGMHHAHRDNGSGWCPFDDIMLAVRHVRRATAGAIQKVVVVDLDAHQGNGVERDKLYFKDTDVFIVDAYNCRCFPYDTEAKRGINVAIELQPGTQDAAYLQRVQQGLQEAAAAFKPDLLVYNAGTDILEGDPLGGLRVSAEGIQQRDEMVWQFAADQRVPIVMLLSGGYARSSAAVISSSLLHLFGKFQLASTASKT